MSKWDTVLTMTSVQMKLWRHTARTYVFPLHLVKNGLIHLPQNLTDLNNFTCTHFEREVGDIFCGRCRNGTGPSVYSLCYMSLDKYSLTTLF